MLDIVAELLENKSEAFLFAGIHLNLNPLTAYYSYAGLSNANRPVPSWLGPWLGRTVSNPTTYYRLASGFGKGGKLASFAGVGYCQLKATVADQSVGSVGC